MNKTLSLTMLVLLWSCENDKKISQDTATSTHELTTNLPPPTQKTDTFTSPLNQNIFTKAAIDLCLCIQPMIIKARQLDDLKKNKQTSDIKNIVHEMSQMQPQIQKCSDDIRKKYVEINDVREEKRVQDALIQECPDIKTILSSKLPK